MNSVIILAGGQGKRFNSKIPKQFLDIKHEKNIIDYSIETFEKNINIDEIILVLPIEWINKFNDKYKNKIIIAGGNNRYESSICGLSICSKESQKVIIHDAARPLVTDEIINNCINFLDDYDAVCPYIDIEDSIIEINNGIKYMNREDLKKVQTPQGFNKDILLNAIKTKNYRGNDDISSLLNCNPSLKVKFFKGDRFNFKITYDSDLLIFKSLINEK